MMAKIAVFFFLTHDGQNRLVMAKIVVEVIFISLVGSDMFCAGRVTEEDLRRTQRACGGAVLSSVRDLQPDALGQCAEFCERQVGGERYNIFTGEWSLVPITYLNLAVFSSL